MAYEELLEKAYKELKQIPITKERFEIPKAKGIIEGNKTIITNFLQICNTLRRTPEHLMKYLSHELAALVLLEENRLILNRKLSFTFINKKLEDYCNEFVICPECGKPDTELIKQDKLMFLHCLACGAKHSVRTKI